MVSRFFRKTRALVYGLTLVGVLAAVAAFLHDRWFPRPLPTITLGRGGNPVYVLMYLAEHHGLYEAAGVRVKVEDFATGRDALSALIEGKVDLSTSYQTPVLLRSFEGNPLRILSALHSASQNTAIVGRTDRGIREAADLAGKKVGLTFDTSAELFLALLAKSNGVPLSKIQTVNLPVTELPAALKEGTVDAICTWQPNLFNAQTALPAGETITFYSENYTEMSLLVGLQPTLNRNRAAVVALLRALAQAEEILHRDPQGAFSVVEKVFPTETGPALRAGWAGVDPALRVDNLLLLTLEQEAELFRQQGRVRASNARIRELIDTSFLNDAIPEAVTLLERPVTVGRSP